MSNSTVTQPHMNPGLGGPGGISGEQWILIAVVAGILIVLLLIFVWAKLHED